MNSTQAQKGFKTFIITLLVSFVVFSAVYYLANQISSRDYANDLANDLSMQVASQDAPSATVSDGAVLGTETVSEPQQPTVPVQDDQPSVFKELANQKPNVQPKFVLAGSTSESTTPPVPETGSTGITLGLAFSTVVFAAGVYWISKDPRKNALKAFEDNVTKNL